MEVKTVEEAIQTELEPMTTSVLVMIQDGLKDYSIDIPLLTIFFDSGPNVFAVIQWKNVWIECVFF